MCGRIPISAAFLILLIVLAADVHAPKIDVNSTGLNFQVTSIGWNNNPDWNIFFQQNKGGMIFQLYDENRMPTTNLTTSINGLDWWLGRKLTPINIFGHEKEDPSARLWKKEDLNSRVQIVSESALMTAAKGFDLNTYHAYSIYPIGRTETGHGILRMVVHMEFTDTNSDPSITYSNFHHTISTTASDAQDFNSYSDNNVLAPAGGEWWNATQYRLGTADANEVIAKGYSGSRTLRFYNKMWNPTAASMWNTPQGTNVARWYAGWSDTDLSPEFSYGEMEYLNYVIFLADTNWFTYIDYPMLQSVHDENRIDYVMMDWRNPADPFMNVGTFNRTVAWDENVGAYDLNASGNLVDFNINTKGPQQANGTWSDMNTTDVNRYRPAFVIRNYTSTTVPAMKINGALGTYDLNYISDVNTVGQYAVVVWYGDLTLPDQNAQLAIAANFAPTALVNSPSDANYLSQYGQGYDHNVAVVFSVSDAENNELKADIYRSASAGAFTTAIINDLNLNNDAALPYLACSSTTWTTAQTCVFDWNVASVPDGNYFLDVNVFDSSDANKVDSSNYSFMIDNTKASTSWDGNATSQTTDANVHLTCNDSGSAGCTTMYRLDTDSSSAVTMGAWVAYDSNIFITADGNWALDFNSTDRAANIGDVNTQYVVIVSSNTAPDVNVTSPSDANYLSQRAGGYDHNVAVVFSVQDADNGMLYADIYRSATAGAFTTAIINDLNLNNDAALPYLACASTTWTTAQTCVFDWNVAGVTDGNYFLDVNVFDASDANKVDSSNVSFMIDNTKPGTSWDGNLAWGTYDQNVHLTCNDAGSGCSLTRYRLDTNSATGVSYGSWAEYDRNVFITADGNYALDFNSTDRAQNIGDTNTKYVLITTPSDLNASASGADFVVGTNQFQLNFDQSCGGVISSLYDLLNDASRNLSNYNLCSGAVNYWSFTHVPTGAFKTTITDATTRLRLDENTNARVKIRAEGAAMAAAGNPYDLNYNLLYTIYPSRKIYLYTQFTDTNTGSTSYSTAINEISGNPNVGWGQYADNDDTSPDADDWWHQMVRTGAGTYHNTSLSYGYRLNGNFYNGKWNPDAFANNGASRENMVDYDLSPEFSAGETDFISYLMIISDDGETGLASDENWLDAVYLDYRTPDDLFMTAGTFQGFDYNTGAYKLTKATGTNRVDFNISTKVGATDVNRYKPAFEISGYTAATVPDLNYNGTAKTQGVDYIADVNTVGQYAVVVWLGDIYTRDVNAQFQIGGAFVNSAPTVTVTSPSDANYLSQRAGGYDHNVAVVFSVQDADNGMLYADIYRSATAGAFTTAIINDLNLNNDAALPYLACASTTWTTAQTCVFDWNVAGVTDGNYFLDVNVFDASDANKVDSSNVSFMIDNTKPATAWDGDHNVWKKASQSITLTCNDAGSAGCTTKYRLDTNGLSSVVTYGAWTAYSSAISMASDGNFAIDFNSTDRAMNIGDVNTKYVLIDQNSPAVSFTSPAADSSTAANSMNVHYSGNDSNGSGILRYWVQMDSLGWINNGTNKTRTFFGLAAGSHTASVIATDNADNNSATASVTFTLTTPAATIRHLDVNATGANFEVGTPDWNLFFDQSHGGVVSSLVDLNRDSRLKANLTNSNYGIDHWHFVHSPSGVARYEYLDASARLGKNEDLNSRVKITSEGAMMDSSGVFDLNFTKTSAIYPSGKWYVTLVLTDTNTGPTSYTGIVRHYECGNSARTGKYTDNSNSAPRAGRDWWTQVVRNDMNSDYDANTSVSRGYDTNTALKFYNGKWTPNSTTASFSGCTTGGGWTGNGLTTQLSAGEVSYLNYMLYISDTREAGAGQTDGNFLDSLYLDYRNPDNLFMTTGTSQGFDVNVGAYKLTATGNRVDFNISTKVGATDVNRYSPAFEIASYTASTRPLMRLNGVDQNEGTNFVADVNTVGQYAVVVWMGNILTTDVNAQFQIVSAWDSAAPTTSWDGNSTWSKYDQNIGLTCTDDSSGCASTKYRLDTDSTSAVTYGAWAAYTGTGISVSSDGNFALDFNSTDTSGNIEATSTKYALVDKTVPDTIADYNAGWTKWDLNVALACTDAMSGCSSTKYRLDTNTAADVQYGSWQTYAAAGISVTNDGNYALDFNSTDAAGGIEDVNTLYLLKDSVAPSTSWDGNAAWQATDANVHLTCSDAGSGCSSTRYRLDADSTSGVSMGNWAAYDRNIFITSDGNWALDFNSTDTAGNIGDMNRKYALLDKTAPDTVADYNAGWTKWDLNVALACTDATSGCSSTKYRLDANSAVAVNYGSWQAYTAAGISVTNDGNYALDFNSTDAAGSVEDVNTLYLLKDSVAPSTAWDGNATWQSTDANIHLTCADANSPNSGCSSTKYRLDTNAASTVSMGAWQAYDANIYIGADGNWALDFNSTDAAGNVGDTNRRYALINKTSPTATITSPADNSSAAGTSITAAYSGSSPVGIVKYYVQIDTNGWIDNGTDTNYTFTDLNYALHTVYVKATDAADTNSATASATVTLSAAEEAKGSQAPEIKKPAEGTQGTEVQQPVEAPPQIETVAESTFMFEQRAQDVRSGLAEFSLPIKQVNDAVSLAGKASIIRGVEITKWMQGGMLYYNSKITLSIKNNSGGTLNGMSVVELMPKEIALDASEINSETPFQVIKADPVIRFMLGDINAGETKEITYSVPNMVSAEAARSAIEFYSSNAPIVAGSPRLGIAENIKYTLLSSLFHYIPTKNEITQTLKSAGMDVSKAAEALRINSLVTLYKGGTVIAEESAQGTTYTTSFTIKVVNSSNKPINDTRVLEVIPKTIAETASLVKANGKYRVLVQDPIIEFEIGTLMPGKSATVRYEVAKKVDKGIIESLSAPVITGSTEQPVKEEVPKDDTLLFIGLAALVVIGVGAFLMKKYRIKLELEI